MMEKSTNNNYKVLEGFVKWYSKKGITRSYASNLKNIQKDIIDFLIITNKWNVVKDNGYEYHVFQFAKKTLLDPKRSYDFIEAIDSLLKEGDYLYARTIADAMIYIAEKFKKEIVAKNRTNTFNDKCSALKLFRKYLETDLSDLAIKGSYDNNNYRTAINKPMLSKIDGTIALANEIGEDKFIKGAIEQSYSVRDSINKSQNPKVDGMDSLIEYINTTQFIKLAIESSYFFSPDLVKERFEEIKDYIHDHKEEDPAFEAYEAKYLPARYSSKEDDADGVQECDETAGKVYFKLPNASQPLCVIYQENARGKNKECNGNTCGGGNGNARVCQLIKSRTGYDLGATSAKKDFRNFIISHIWGHAIDPRYFTNLWNIVIVPAWANHLLDKDEEGTLASTFKATIQKIISELYGLKGFDWKSMQMEEAPAYNEDEVINGRFQINIIERKSGDTPFGKISKESVTI